MTLLNVRGLAGARRAVALATAAGALAGSALHAQAAENRFTVTTRAGAVTFDRASSLKTAGAIGLDTEFGFSKYFGVGTAINVTRANTRAEDFITSITLGTADTGSTTSYYGVSQPVSLVEASLYGVVRAPMGRTTPYASAGAGYYAFYFDPQVNNGQKRVSDFSGHLGAGLAFQLSQRAGISLDLRDVILTNYNASAFDPSGGRNANINFPEDLPHPPARKSTINSFIYSIGFRYVPQFGGSDQEGGK